VQHILHELNRLTLETIYYLCSTREKGTCTVVCLCWSTNHHLDTVFLVYAVQRHIYSTVQCILYILTLEDSFTVPLVKHQAESSDKDLVLRLFHPILFWPLLAPQKCGYIHHYC